MPKARTLDQQIRTWTSTYVRSASLNRITRANDPYLTTTAGAYNTVYTTDLVIQMAGDSTALGVVGMSGWPSSGFSTISAYPTQSANNGVDAYGGTPEGGNLADTIKPTLKEIKPVPKTIQANADMSVTMSLLGQTGDNTIMTPEGARAFALGNFKKRVNDAMLNDISQHAGSSASAAYSYLSYNRFSALDNIVSNKAQADAVDTHSTNNGWFNSYNGGFNRRTSTAFDSVVASAGTNLTTVGTLTADKIEDLVYDIYEQSAEFPDVMITSPKVQNAINKLYKAELRYGVADGLSETTIGFGTAGLENRSGNSVGIKVASLQGIPICHSVANMTSTTTNDDGRIYALTRNSVNNGGIRPILSVSTLLTPTAVINNALSSGAALQAAGAFVNTLTYVIMGEVVCTKPTAQGKLIGINL